MEELAKSAVDGARGYDGGIYALIVTIVIVAMISAPLFYTYLRLVIVPNNKANRDSSSKLAEATSAIAKIMAENHALTGNIKKDTGDLKGRVTQLTNCMGAGVRAIDKLARHSNVDVSSELGEMKGALLPTDKES